MSSGTVFRVSAKLALDARAELAEGPVWDDRRRVLWWVDILAGRVHRFEPASAAQAAGTDSVIEMGRAVGCVALTEQGALVVAAADAVLLLDPRTGIRETLVRFEPGTANLRCNDGKCDPRGRFWVGRMALDRAPGAASLVRLDGSTVQPVLRGLTIPNGLDWSWDGRRMYFVDSPESSITVMDFDLDTGTAGPRRVFFRTRDVAGLPSSSVPDGLTIDSEGCLWVAIWGGGCVLRLAPDGTVIARVDVPVSRVSSCVFGGDDLMELFITTAREDASDEELAAEPTAGGIFRVRPGVRGRPPNRMSREATEARRAH